MAVLTFDLNSQVFVARVSFVERSIAKAAGFQWNQISKVWYTESPETAARLKNFADESALQMLGQDHGKAVARKPSAGRVPVPPGLTPYPFQINSAVPWILANDKTYLAARPGLGKTICAALKMNARGHDRAAVYVCPPFLMENVEEEMGRWTTPKRTVYLYRGGAAPAFPRKNAVLLIPDTLLGRDDVQRTIALWATMGADLYVDEAHRFKTATAQRTKFLFKKIAPKFRNHTYLSGTPMPNRPIELYPVLHAAGVFRGSYFDFGLRYCAGFKSEWGWDFTGTSNFRELNDLMHRSFMLTIHKEDVLPELPAKHETVVWIGDVKGELKKLEKKILAEHAPEDLASVVGDTHLMTYTRLLGEEKASHAITHARETIEQGRAILIFAVHKDVIAKIADGLKDYKPLVIDGSVGNEERFRRAKLFQESKEHPVMVLNITAGGVGFNLTKASEVLFAENRWVPAELEQAADRAHRIGQKDFVNVRYLCFKDSLDSIMLSTVLNKRGLTKHV